MIVIERQITQLITPAVNALGYELLGVKLIGVNHGSLLRVYINHQHGISVDDCAKVSHQVSGLLNVEYPVAIYYYLEVSSPGEDRPLFTLAHYHQLIGQRVALVLYQSAKEQRKWCGVINAVENSTIILQVDQQCKRIAFDHIKTANIKLLKRRDGCETIK